VSIADRVAGLLGTGVLRTEGLSGGSLSTVVRVHLAGGLTAIAKLHAAAASEADMLRAIAASGAPAPRVIAAADDLLVLEDCPAGGALSDAWDSLAHSLAALHAASGPSYGWACDHAFGAVVIQNNWSDDWPAFWAARRLLCHVPHLDAELAGRLERLASSLPEQLPRRPHASLLHGDLWGGNVLVRGGRVTALIDPACYYGDREVDAAMLTLFDRPPPRFSERLELAAGWQDRLPVYRLWPLLVHLRLFGAAYRRSVIDALDRSGA
jgi:fructosamine-3-kinase